MLTSALNGCSLCTAGHIQQLTEDGRGALAEAVLADPDTVRTGEPPLDALLDYTRILVRRPGNVTAEDITRLRAQGFDDFDILDVNNLAAYYCYINRVANGLGLQGGSRWRPLPPLLSQLPGPQSAQSKARPAVSKARCRCDGRHCGSGWQDRHLPRGTPPADPPPQRPAARRRCLRWRSPVWRRPPHSKPARAAPRDE